MAPKDTKTVESKAGEKTRTDESSASKVDLKSLVEALVTANVTNLDLPDDKLIAAPLGFEAMEDAAGEIAEGLGKTIRGSGNKILVTSNVDLAPASVAFVEVDNALSALLALTKLPEEGGSEGTPEKSLVPAATGVLAGVADALPSLLSLLTPKLTVRVAPVAANDLAAAAAVVQALRKGDPQKRSTFVHDDFRLLPTGKLREKLGLLAEQRLALLRKKLTLPAESTEGADIDAALKAIDDFGAALRAVPEGGGRSLLAAALLAAPLHDSPPDYDHVLLVKAETGQSQQSIQDRPFFADDKVSVFTELAITVVFIKVETSEILASATVSGKAHAFGSVGSELQISRPGTTAPDTRPRRWWLRI